MNDGDKPKLVTFIIAMWPSTAEWVVKWDVIPT